MLEFQVRVEGLEHFNELSEIFASIRRLEFQLLRNGAGEIDLDLSLQSLDAAVDRKLARFSRNPLAKQVSDWAKQHFRERIRKYAAQSGGGGSGIFPTSSSPF